MKCSLGYISSIPKCTIFALSSFEGLAEAISISLYRLRLSSERITPLYFDASSRDSAVFPDAVCPSIAISLILFPLFFCIPLFFHLFPVIIITNLLKLVYHLVMKNILKNFNELVMFKHSIFSLPFIFIAMIVASNGWFGWRLLVLGLLAAVSARNFAMSFNRFVDRDIDIKNPRTALRPSVDGRIDTNKIVAFIVVNAGIFIAVAYLINSLAFILSFPILLILSGYSLFKRFSSFAHIILGLSLGLAPIAGVVAVSESIPLWSILLSLGVVFWVAGFDLLYSLQDIEFDKEEGLHSMPSIYGSRCTLLISKIFHGLTVLFWLLFIISYGGGVFAYIGIVVSAYMLYVEHKIVNKDFNKIDKAFFTMNGYLGIIFFVFILLDIGG